jgi:hypothetical protein
LKYNLHFFSVECKCKIIFRQFIGYPTFIGVPEFKSTEKKPPNPVKPFDENIKYYPLPNGKFSSPVLLIDSPKFSGVPNYHHHLRLPSISPFHQKSQAYQMQNKVFFLSIYRWVTCRVALAIKRQGTISTHYLIR